MSWLFSQALVEEFSAGTSLAGAPSAQLNVTPTPHKFWRNDKTMEFSQLSQFGLTLQLLTVGHGAELLASFLAASRAKGLAQQDLGGGLKATSAADYGRTSSALFARLCPITSSWKTAQCSLLEDLGSSLETWPRWGSMRNGACYLLPNLAPTIYAKDSGLLPTPTRSWSTRGPGISKNLGNMRASHSVTLTCLAISEATTFRWPASFTEWMMGWPIQWTALQPLGMAKFQEWQQQHGGF